MLLPFLLLSLSNKVSWCGSVDVIAVVADAADDDNDENDTATTVNPSDAPLKPLKFAGKITDLESPSFFLAKRFLLNFFNLVQIINYTMFVDVCIISHSELYRATVLKLYLLNTD